MNGAPGGRETGVRDQESEVFGVWTLDVERWIPPLAIRVNLRRIVSPLRGLMVFALRFHGLTPVATRVTPLRG